MYPRAPKTTKPKTQTTLPWPPGGQLYQHRTTGDVVDRIVFRKLSAMAQKRYVLLGEEDEEFPDALRHWRNQMSQDKVAAAVSVVVATADRRQGGFGHGDPEESYPTTVSAGEAPAPELIRLINHVDQYLQAARSEIAALEQRLASVLVPAPKSDDPAQENLSLPEGATEPRTGMGGNLGVLVARSRNLANELSNLNARLDTVL